MRPGGPGRNDGDVIRRKSEGRKPAGGGDLESNRSEKRTKSLARKEGLRSISLYREKGETERKRRGLRIEERRGWQVNTRIGTTLIKQPEPPLIGTTPKQILASN